MIYRNDCLKGTTENTTSGTPFRVQKNNYIRKFVIKESKSITKGVKKKYVHVIFLCIFFSRLRAMKKKEEGGQGGRKCNFHS